MKVSLILWHHKTFWLRPETGEAVFWYSQWYFISRISFGIFSTFSDVNTFYGTLWGSATQLRRGKLRPFFVTLWYFCWDFLFSVISFVFWPYFFPLVQSPLKAPAISDPIWTFNHALTQGELWHFGSFCCLFGWYWHCQYRQSVSCFVVNFW